MRSKDIIWGDLKQLYIDQLLSRAEIAKLKNCSTAAVLWHLKKQQIPRRNNLQAQAIRFAKQEHYQFLKTKKGYLMEYRPDHPYANSRGFVMQHRLVMEKKIGRYLLPSEKVHHKGTKFPLGSLENKSDNRDENLILVTKDSHQIMEEMCQQCKLAKEIRLLRWQIKQLTELTQLKLKEEI